MLWCESPMGRVSPSVCSGMRVSTSCPSSRTTQSGIGAGGFNGGVGASAVTSGGADAGTGRAVDGAGAGVAAGVAVATNSC